MFDQIKLSDIANLAQLVIALGTVGAAIGVYYVRLQLKHAQQQAMTSYEDQLNREYRTLLREIPPTARCQPGLNTDELEKYYAAFYGYLDLCNEEVFLRREERISEATWKSWRDGIKSHLSRGAFGEAWKKAKKDSDSFLELRCLEETGFLIDPAAPRSSCLRRLLQRLGLVGALTDPWQEHYESVSTKVLAQTATKPLGAPSASSKQAVS